MTFNTINTFNQIKVTNKKPLIICDIDNTLLHHGRKIEYFINIARAYNKLASNEQIIMQANDLMNIHCSISSAKHTDFEGFNTLLDKVKSLNGKLIFLTARDSVFEYHTIKHFVEIGLNYNDFEVHYTCNKISKGDYIKLNIDVTEWNEIIFIDDLDINLLTVSNKLPNVKCYKFEILDL